MASEQTKILPQGKVTNEDTEMLSKKKMENEITKMLPEKEMANEETKIVLEGESADGETNILLKKESANGETKLYCMDSGDGPYSYARCSCSQKDLVDAATKEMENEDSKMLQEKEMTNGKTKMLMDKEVSNGESYHMNSGDGPYSYAKYSSYQKAIVDAAKKMLVEAISDNLDINNPSFGSSNTLRIADMGCSIGPNAFIAVQNIVEAVTLKYQSMQQKPQALEFHVFFNDHIANDFNALFRSLPPSRPYFAVGVPGSFHGRLFPKSSLHIVHSSYALHWLSKVPKEVMEINFLGLKNGRNYSTTDEEVLEVFSSQYKRDMQSFLTARAQELVGGGLMVLLVTGISQQRKGILLPLPSILYNSKRVRGIDRDKWIFQY
ncbi:loganic acid O-methyltransferase isoform X2 [Vitis vinifera]|uniref:loganic acid O-methyltransferase isoform X2 n=1 Tax=Vitis vinifera TaxID=29760 RepID=UPI0008FEB7BD|nr:loganic acid O-methyltransferase isoform X2 [Vitis vinifera]|eukprot:XP_019080290.1 PREDICTED: probable S-adenosylmethionine-dependent methyltransferase At5g37990 isoform X2 [Vitis vinifera]